MAERDRRETEFERMQRQATERMREMQRRARPPGMPPTPSFVQIPGRPTPEPEPEKAPKPKPSRRPARNGFDLFRLLNFKNLELDSDRILILGLALLLSSEETDELLVLALLYIML